MSAPAAGFAPWVQYARRVPGEGTVLVCFPHAGGSASAYRGWTAPLADHGIEVWPIQLPGREGRYSEPFATDLDELTTTLADLLHAHLGGRPYAVYGHSAGAMLACGFTLAATRRGRPGPRHVFLGACRPPARPDPDFPIHRLARAPFLERLFGYGRMPAEILDFPEMAERMIDTARADLALVETAAWPPRAALGCPVTALGGVSDATVPADTLPDWKEITDGPFESVLLPGGHFPPPSAQALVLEVIRRGLS